MSRLAWLWRVRTRRRWLPRPALGARSEASSGGPGLGSSISITACEERARMRPALILRTWGARGAIGESVAGVRLVHFLVRRFSSGAEGVVGAYQRLVDGGKLQAGDRAQEQVVSSLDVLSREIADGESPSWLRGTFSAFSPYYKRLVHRTRDPVRGIYMYGGVGTGKTMLMDLFYNSAEVQKKRRIHFHAFMLEIHMRLHNLSVGKNFGAGSDEPIKAVAQQILSEARLICLDEVEVTDVADALILKRLFAELWPEGAVLVATSNSTPDQLYRNGLNRHLFVPFIQQLKEYCRVYSLDGGRDYRRGHTNLRQVYLYPLTDDTDAAMHREFLSLTGGHEGSTMSISVMMGRFLQIVCAQGVARASFSYLCGGAYGAADYYAIAKNFRALVLDRIPWLGDPAKENELRRFINLVDILYESNTILVCSAALPLERLFDESPHPDAGMSGPKDYSGRSEVEKDMQDVTLQIVGEGGSAGRSTSLFGGMEWSGTGRPGASIAGLQRSSFTRLATARIVSRLTEMQSEAYVSRAEQKKTTTAGLVPGQGQASGIRQESHESPSVN